MKKELELRMYGLVIYQLSGIQQGIQFDHAKDEYAEKHGKDKDYLAYRKKHKTVVVLNGGTSNNGEKTHYGYPKQLGTMEQHLKLLKDNKIKCAPFYEPDLNYALTSIAFLVNERVFDKKQYPDFSFTESDFKKSDYYTWIYNPTLEDNINDYQKYKDIEYKRYVNSVGKDVAFLKEFLKQFRLA